MSISARLFSSLVGSFLSGFFSNFGFFSHVCCNVCFDSGVFGNVSSNFCFHRCFVCGFGCHFSFNGSFFSFGGSLFSNHGRFFSDFGCVLSNFSGFYGDFCFNRWLARESKTGDKSCSSSTSEKFLHQSFPSLIFLSDDTRCPDQPSQLPKLWLGNTARLRQSGGKKGNMPATCSLLR